MTNTFSTTGAQTHSTTVSGLQNGQTYNYYVRCRDLLGNINADDYRISFSVASCTLTSAAWSKNNANEGEQVQLRVTGTGCDGNSIGFVIKEDDVYSADDDVNVNPAAATFANGVATGAWTAEYVGDELFSAPEYYFIATLTSDASKSIQSSSNSLLSVSPVSTQNRAPIINAGADQTITLSSFAGLRGIVSDDELPINGKLTAMWSKVSGPGTVTFVNASNESTVASFSAAGTYVLRLTASDSLLTGSDDVIITVNAQGGGGNNYYVSTTGNDANTGTSQTSPWKHAPGDSAATGNAAATALKAGDIVKFKGGVDRKSVV